MIEQSNNSNVNIHSDSIISNKEFLYKGKWSDRIFLLLIYILYIGFFALLPSLYIFSKIYLASQNAHVFNEQIMICVLLIIGIFSIFAINWVFQGSYKQVFSKNIYIAHFINALSLVAIVITLALPQFASTIRQGVDDDFAKWADIVTLRSFVYLIAVVSWFALFVITNGIITFRTKKMFSLPWFKFKINVIGSLFLAAAIALSFILAKKIQESGAPTDKLNLIFIIAIVIIVALDILYVIFAYIYTKLYKQALLSNKTEQEMDSIQNSRKLLFLIKASVAALIIFFGASIVFVTNSGITLYSNFVLIGINSGLDVLIIIVFWVIVDYQKWATVATKKKSKSRKSISITSLDLSLLVKLVTWLIFTKLFVIINVTFAKRMEVGQSPWLMVSSGLAALVIYLLCWVYNINFPNIKATSSLIINFIIFVIIFVATIFIYSWFTTNQFTTNFDYIAAFVMGLTLIGLSIELFLAIFSTRKLYASAKQQNNNSDVKKSVVNKKSEAKPKTA